jgi:hypothetical protein
MKLSSVLYLKFMTQPDDIRKLQHQIIFTKKQGRVPRFPQIYEEIVRYYFANSDN